MNDVEKKVTQSLKKRRYSQNFTATLTLDNQSFTYKLCKRLTNNVVLISES